MTSPGTNSRDIFLGAVRGIEAAGFDVLRWEIGPMLQLLQRVQDPKGRAALAGDLGEQFRAFVESNRVDLSVGLWGNAMHSLPVVQRSVSDGERRAASFFEAIGHDHVLFWLDAPHWAANGAYRSLDRTPLVASERLHHVVNNPVTADEMNRVLGYGRCLGRSYGIDPDQLRPQPDITPVHDVVFGSGPGDAPPTPLMLAELARPEPDLQAVRLDEAERLRPKLAELAGRWSASTSGRVDRDAAAAVLDRLLHVQLEKPGVPMLERLDSIGADRGPDPEPALAAAARSLAETPRAFVEATATIRQIEHFRRAFTVSFLSKHLRVAVFGQGAFEGWPCDGVRRLGYVDFDRMSAAYASGRLGLNVMRYQDEQGLNVKPFEVSASGRVCLCEDRPGLAALLTPGEEVAPFGSPAEALEIARGLLASDARRESMQAAARERVLRDHTWKRWGEDVVAFAKHRQANAAPDAAPDAAPVAA